MSYMFFDRSTAELQIVSVAIQYLGKSAERMAEKW